MTESIHFILTGGTIDSFYYPPKETSVPNTASVIPDYIESKIKPHISCSYETLCMLDSGDITDDIRERILNAIQNAKTTRVIVTHGTNTMAKTLEFLDGKTSDKTIVLTGAMIPLKEFAMSDAGFNLGYAIAQAQQNPPGIYLCMNARTFRAGGVTKNTSIGRFEEA